MIEVEGIRPEDTLFIPNGIPAPPAAERRATCAPSSASRRTRR